MKKTFVFALALAGFSFVNIEANAQSDTTQTAVPQEQQTEQAQPAQEKVKIEQEALPEAVKEALKSDTLKEWTVSEVFQLAPDAADATAKPTYEVFFTNAEQKQAKAIFDEQGKIIN